MRKRVWVSLNSAGEPVHLMVVTSERWRGAIPRCGVVDHYHFASPRVDWRGVKGLQLGCVMCQRILARWRGDGEPEQRGLFDA